MKKSAIILLVISVTIILAGCGSKKSEEAESNDYFDEGYVPGVFKAYDGSKERIDNVVNQEDKKIQDAMKEAGL